MSPSFPISDRTCRCGAYPEHWPYDSKRDFLRLPNFSQFDNALIRHFRQIICFSYANWAGSSPLIHCILRVIEICSNSQMIWVTARPVSNARMQYKEAIWNVCFVMGNPRYFVGREISSPGLSSTSKLAIAFIEKASFPVPAFGFCANVNSRPKSFLNGWREELIKAILRYRLLLHNSVSLICATLSAVRSARGHFYFCT